MNGYKIYNLSILEIFLFLLTASVQFWIRNLFDLTPDLRADAIILQMVVIVLFVGGIIAIMQYRLGTNDFRTKIGTHMLPFIVGFGLALTGTAAVEGVYEYAYAQELVTLAELNSVLNTTRLIMVSTGLSYIVVLILELVRMSDPYIKEFDNATKAYLEGNISSRITSDLVMKDSNYGRIGTFINNVLNFVGNLVNDIADASTIINTASGELLTGSEEVNASAEEVASTSQAMGHGATTQTELINEVSEEIKNTTKLVDEIIASIRSNTNQVSQIALQTNILALNAGIEASRAGDYGRGFAVVAENIRKLSDQSKTASEGISEVADEIAARLEEAFNRISSTMLNVVSVSEETAASAEEVAAAAEEMTATMEEITTAATQLSTKAEESNTLVKDFLK